MSTKRPTYDTLDELGDAIERVLSPVQAAADPETVATILRGRGIKGERENPERGPLAMLVHPLLPDDTWVEVSLWERRLRIWHDDRIAEPYVVFEFWLSEVTALFTYKFNQRCYPDLIA
jgi:hypothetical protein